jgi:two-component system NtrC family response regulator
MELTDGTRAVPMMTLKEAREKIEKEMVIEALKRNAGKISPASSDLGISRPTLYELIQKLGISTQEFALESEKRDV